MADCLFPVVNANFTDARWQLLQKLLCATNAAAGGGGGSSGANLQGVVDPGGVVASTAIGQFYTNTATGSLWQSNAVGTGGWVQLV